LRNADFGLRIEEALLLIHNPKSAFRNRLVLQSSPQVARTLAPDERRNPVTSAADEEKYTLDYFTTGERAADEPPFKYRTFYLDDALAEAWRITRDGGAPLRVTKGGEVVSDEDDLKDAFERMSELEAEQPGSSERELAALFLEESGDGGKQA
jgi:hypothetical protein